MKASLLAAVMTALVPQAVSAQAAEEPDPATIDVVDLIECRVDAPTYNGFAFALDGDDGIVATRHWTAVASKRPTMTEYELPAPITVAGRYRTRRIAFTSNGVVAILDLPDPAPLAREQGIANQADAGALVDALGASGEAPPAALREMKAAGKASGMFRGEKIVSDRSEAPTRGARVGTRTVIARTVSALPAYPGKTLYGCSYRIDAVGPDGKVL
ncbi:hypothetical protein [uncultured Sphingomonas sp.]|uniref:hypothetical protein n=1 Tax=uncultured Sphingomonas sp. TaxID=158754 RepID=UPI0025ED3121|nr:hypothetical protein [uncultured Sphingomonas sp.]